MALTRMVESFSPSNFKFLSEKPNKDVESAIQKIEESLKEKPQALEKLNDLKESIESFKKNNLKESSLKPIDEQHKVWTVPISRYDHLCLNNRIYPKALWENVINNQKHLWCGIPGLADHPVEDDDAGSIKNSCIVWLDLQLDEQNKLVWGTGVFVGEIGKMLQEIIEVGGKVGFSSSGFGELIPGSQTVNPDTYQIERIADVVLNPSQDVYGDLNPSEDHDFEKARTIEYSRQEIIKENKMKENVENKLVEEVGGSLITIEDLKEDFEKAIRDAYYVLDMEITDNSLYFVWNCGEEGVFCSFKMTIVGPNKIFCRVYEGGIISTATITASNTVELAEKVNDVLHDAIRLPVPNKSMQEATINVVPQKSQIVEETTKTTEAPNTTEAPTETEEELKENKMQTLLAKSYIQNFIEHEMPSLSQEEKIEKLMLIKESLEDVDNESKLLIEKELNGLLNKNSKTFKEAVEIENKYNLDSIQEVSDIIEALENKLSENKEDTEAVKTLSKKLIERNKLLRKALEKKEVRLNLLEKAKNREQAQTKESFKNHLVKEEVLTRKNNKMKKLLDDLNESNRNYEKKINYQTKVINKLSEKVDSNETEKDVKIENLLKKIERLQKVNYSLNEKVQAVSNNFENFKEQIEYEKNPMKHLKPSISQSTKEYLDLSEGYGEAVKEYYKDLYNRFGEGIVPFKREILGCKSVREATRVFLENKEEIDEGFRRVQEAYSIGEGVQGEKRKEMLEELGMKFDGSRDSHFYENLKKLGLK